MTSGHTRWSHAGPRPQGSVRPHGPDAVSCPENPGTPHSDASTPAPSCLGATPWCPQANAGGGAALMELQFYPPGEAPFADSISCDHAPWCAALITDSPDCTLNLATCNPSCIDRAAARPRRDGGTKYHFPPDSPRGSAGAACGRAPRRSAPPGSPGC